MPAFFCGKSVNIKYIDTYNASKYIYLRVEEGWILSVNPKPPRGGISRMWFSD